MESVAKPRIFLTGARGLLGGRFADELRTRADLLCPGREEFDITRRGDHGKVLDWNPEVVINAAAWTDVDGCARDPERALEVNGLAPGRLAEWAAGAGAMFIQISTNEVFDGTLERAYREDDKPNPLNPYGASKLAGERNVADANPDHIIVRTAWLYFGRDRMFPGKIRDAAERAWRTGKPLRVVSDEWGNPTNAGWLASATLALLELVRTRRAPCGVYHLAGVPGTSRLDWARRILAPLAGDIEPIHLAEFPRASRVPERAVLDTSRAAGLGIQPYDWRMDWPR